jgi:hypothetical protein
MGFRRLAFALPLASLIASVGAAPARAQPPLLGPTQSQAMPAATTWPAAPPARIYVLPFRMDPVLQQQLAQQAAPVIPQGPVRSLFASRPRVVDAVTGYDRSEPPGFAVARLVAEEMASAGWPAVFWGEAAPPPADPLAPPESGAGVLPTGRRRTPRDSS